MSDTPQREDGWYWRLRLRLCRVGFHRWDFVGIGMIPTGAYVGCRYCKKARYQPWI